MKEKKDKHFIKKPIYPGGQEAFKKFIADELKYPKEALEKKIEGTVVLKYSIDYKGKVKDVKVVKSLGHGCDEEAVRVIKMLKFEIPKEPRKLRVLFHKENKIFFKIPPEKKQAPQQSKKITYTVVNTPAQDQKEGPGSSGSYSYKIEW